MYQIDSLTHKFKRLLLFHVKDTYFLISISFSGRTSSVFFLIGSVFRRATWWPWNHLSFHDQCSLNFGSKFLKTFWTSFSHFHLMTPMVMKKKSITCNLESHLQIESRPDYLLRHLMLTDAVLVGGVNNWVFHHPPQHHGRRGSQEQGLTIGSSILTPVIVMSDKTKKV